LDSEDAACNRLTELALNDVSMAGSILAEAVGSSAFAVAAVANAEAHEAFQKVRAMISLDPAVTRTQVSYSSWTLGDDCREAPDTPSRPQLQNMQ